ncbi:YadA-like family protein [Moraxella sp. ZJ142]|uniref:YadA-like family protein n=1 Tax=Moraxella marmotae TaxID=3344520 RepID=UPI0035D4FC45
MNKLYRVIFNRSTQTFQAVCEFARAQGKSSSAAVGSTEVNEAEADSQSGIAKAAVAISIAGAAMLGSAQAMAVVDKSANGLIYVDGTGPAITTETDSIAIGGGAKTGNTGTIAIGAAANANDVYGVAIGYKAESTNAGSMTADASVVIGAAAKTANQSSVVVGSEAKVELTSGTGGTAVGSQARVTGDTGTALGIQAQALASAGLAAGRMAKAESTNGVAIGQNAVAGDAAVSAATPMGQNDEARGATAVGSAAKATRWGATALGNAASATANKTIALGSQAAASALFATAIGNGTAASGINATVLGTDSKATAENATAIGAGTTVGNKDTVALGRGITSTQDNSVILGSQSTDRAATKENTATVGPWTYNGFAGSSPTAVASIGAVGAERQLINVAAGKISATSTDAINGSQLYAAMNAIPKYVAGTNVAFNDNGDGTTTINVNTPPATPAAPIETTDVTTNFADNYHAANYSRGPNEDAGKASIGTNQDGNKLVNGTTLVKAINESGWQLTVGAAADSNGENTSEIQDYNELISPNDVVTFQAGDGIQIKQQNATITISTVPQDPKAPETTTLTVTDGKIAAPTDETDGDKLVNATNIANAVNNVSWSVGGPGGTKVADVKAGNQVNFVSGCGTTAVVTAGAKPGETNVTFNVNTAGDTFDKNNVTFAVTGPEGYVTGNTLDNATTYLTLKGMNFTGNNAADQKDIHKNLGETLTVAGGVTDTNATPVSDKNTYVENNGTALIVKIAETPEFKGVNLTNANGTVNLTPTTNGTLTLSNATGGDVTLSGIEKGAKTFAETGAPSTDATKNLLDLNNSTANNALTVEDAKKLGWVVAASKNKDENNAEKAYEDSVTNAQKVDFVGENGIQVNGKTDGETRTITIKADTTTVTNNANGSVSIDTAANPAQNGNSLVTGDTLVNAINKSGWTLKTGTDGGTDSTAADAKDKSELINPGEEVTIKAGKNVDVKRDGSNITISATAENTTLTVTNGTIAAPATGEGDKLVNATNIANAVNNVSWAIAGNDGEKVNDVKAGSKVNFVNGTGTTATVSKGEKDGETNVTFNVVATGDNFNANSPASDFEVTDKTGFVNGDTLTNATMHLTAKGINFQGNNNATAEIHKNLGETLTVAGGANNPDGTAAKEVSDKNTYVENNGTALIVKIAETPEFKGVNLTNANGTVNLTPTTNGTLTLSNATGGDVTLSGIEKGAKTFAETGAPSTDATKNLLDLNNSTANNALTVEDAKKLGWVVAASKNKDENNAEKAYEDSVTNAQKVDFVGENGIQVNGKTDGETRTITIKADTTTVTNNANGSVSIDTAANPAQNGNSLVTGDTLVNAINKSGWTLKTGTDGGTDSTAADAKDKSELINPGEEVTIKAGKNVDVKRDGSNITISATAENTTLTVTNGTIAAPATGEGDKLVNATNIANAVNNVSWAIAGNDGEKVNDVKAGSKVNFVNGTGTTATVSKGEKDGETNVTFNVVATGDNFNANSPASDFEVTDKTGFVNGDTLTNATMHLTAKGINFQGNNNATAEIHKNLGETLTVAGGANNPDGTAAKEVSDKNTYVENNGTALIVKIAETPEFKGVNLTNANGTVNLTPTTNGTLTLSNATGGDVTLSGIEKGAKTFAETGAPSTDATKNLLDLNNSTANNALTVEDAKKLGWVVAASKNKDENNAEKAYEDSVTNAQKVDFVGENGIQVNGKTDGETRTITIKADTATLGLSNSEPNPNEEGATISNGTVVVPEGQGDKLVNATNVADAINNASWTIAGNDAKKVNDVKAGSQVNFVNGIGTTAVVTKKDDGTTNVTFNSPLAYVNAKDGKVTDDLSTPSNTVVLVGTGDNLGPVSLKNTASGLRDEIATTENATKPFNTVLANATGDTLNNAVNVSDLKNAVGGIGFNLTTKQVKDAVNAESKVEENLAEEGKRLVSDETFTLDAGNNIKIKQIDNGYEVATSENVTFNNVNATTLTVGNVSDAAAPKVDFKAEKAEKATNNPEDKAPVSALNVTTTVDGKETPTQITGVGSVLNTTDVATNGGNTDGTPVTTEKPGTPDTSTLVNLGSKESPLDEKTLNSAATVRDIANMGWVVEAEGNGYTNTVKNADKVNFKGEGGLAVTGSDVEKDGKTVRTITIKADTATLGLSNSEPNPNEEGATISNGTVVVPEGQGDKLVNATNVADAINNASWTIAGNDAKKVNDVKAGSQVNFVNGIGTTAVVTKKDDGTTNVTFNSPLAYVNAKDGKVTDDLSTPSNTVVLVGTGDNLGPVSLKNTASGLRDEIATTENATKPFNTVLANATGDTLNNAVNVSDLKNAVGGIGFNLTTKQVKDAVNAESKVEENLAEEGKRLVSDETFTLDAGNNIKIKQIDNGYEVATSENVTFNNVNATTLTVGNVSDAAAPKVDFKAEKAEKATNNPEDKAPVSALNVTTTVDGKETPTQITGVGSVLNTTDVATNGGNTDGTPVTTEKPGTPDTSTLVNLGSKESPLDEKTLNSAATVRDIANMGWVVEAEGNGYTNTVKNADKVNFKGEGGLAVTGSDVEKDGKTVRTITIKADTATLGLSNSEPNPNEEGATISNGTVVVPEGQGDKLVNATNVADAINNASWTIAGNDAKKVNDVKAGSQVNFVNGIGTTAVVTKKDDGTTNVTFNSPLAYVNAKDGKVTDDLSTPSNTVVLVGTGDNLGPVSLKNTASGLRDEIATTENATKPFNTVLANATGDTLNNAVNVSDLKNAVGGIGFNLTTKQVKDAVNAESKVEENLAEEGKRLVSDETFTLDAGNNIKIKQIDNGYEVATSENVTFNNVNATTLTVGNVSDAAAPKVDFKAEKAEKATNNPEDKAPVSALNVTTTVDGKETPTQITGVGSVLNTTDVATNPGDTVGKDGNKVPGVTNPKGDKLVNLKDLPDNIQNSAATVRDIANMGWVVEAEGNGYTNTVKNADKVNFKGEGGLAVTGSDVEKDGKTVRTITIKADTATLGLSNSEPNPNEEGATISNGTVVVPEGQGDKLVNATNVADAINNASWTIAGNDAKKVNDVKAGSQVNFVNGIGTTAVVTKKDDGTTNVTFNSPLAYVNAKDGKVTDDLSTPSNTVVLVGTGDNLGPVSLKNTASGLRDEIATTENATKPFNTVLANATGDTLNNAVNVSDLKNAVGGIGFNLTTKQVKDAVNAESKVEENLAEEGKRLVSDETFTLDAGNNIKIKQIDNGYEVATSENVTFNNVNATTLTVGNVSDAAAPKVDFKAEKAEKATNNPEDKAPVSALNVTTTVDGKETPTQITGVGSVLNTTDVATNPGDTVGKDGNKVPGVTNPKGDKLVNLKDLPDNIQNSAATVRDIANMGWVVSTSGNNYTDTVKNANKVDFKGGDGVTVTGTTTADGTRQITVGVDEAKIANNTLAKLNFVDGKGTTANVSQPAADGSRNITFDVATTDLSVMAAGKVKKPVEGDKLVNATTVTNAINNSGWRVTGGKEGTGIVNGKTTELVQPGEEVTFKAGNNLVLDQKAQNFTYSLAKDIDINSVKANEVKAGPVTINQNGIDAGGKRITNVSRGVAPTDAVNKSQLDEVANAVGNVSWGIGGADGKKVADVKSGNQVNFVNGTGTTAVVTKGANGTTNVTFNIATGNVKFEDGKATAAEPNKVATTGDVANVTNGAVANLTAKGLNFQGNDGVEIHKDLGQTLTVKGGVANATTTPVSAKNTYVESNGKELIVKIADRPEFTGMNLTNGTSTVNLDPVTDRDGTTALNLNQGGDPVRIKNVAPGIDGTDAVNVDQLKGVAGNLANSITGVANDANAGVSSAMAMAALPQAYIPGKSMLTGGVASYNGQGAIAVGLSRLSDNGRWVLKVSGSADSQGNAGGSVGAGFHF